MTVWTLYWSWNDNKSVAHTRVKGGRLLCPKEEVEVVEKSEFDALQKAGQFLHERALEMAESWRMKALAAETALKIATRRNI